MHWTLFRPLTRCGLESTPSLDFITHQKKNKVTSMMNLFSWKLRHKWCWLIYIFCGRRVTILCEKISSEKKSPVYYLLFSQHRTELVIAAKEKTMLSVFCDRVERVRYDTARAFLGSSVAQEAHVAVLPPRAGNFFSILKPFYLIF